MMNLRQRSVVAVVAVTVGVLGMTTACGKDEKPAPTSTPSTTTTTPASSTAPAPPSPTEKGLDGAGGPNSFSPTVKAPPAPTAIPGSN